jgi:purine-nucleoside phosphorylase
MEAHMEEVTRQQFRTLFTRVAPCDTAVILGSGWNDWVDTLDVETSLDYRELFAALPGFEVVIPGHAGRVSVARYGGRRLLVFQGRFHLYQGLTAWQAALPVRLAADAGCGKILLTNAVGGIASHLTPGEFVLIEDHLNFQGDNPLRGLQPSPFIDLSNLYQTHFYAALHQWASPHGITLKKGVLAALTGPSYETPAEIRALERLGADVASMSMVPEAIVARYLGLDVVGLSLVTNPAAGRSEIPLSHDDVLLCAQRASTAFPQLLKALLERW